MAKPDFEATRRAFEAADDERAKGYPLFVGPAPAPCEAPDQFGGHKKPFVLVTDRLRLCTGCGRVDDNSGFFRVRKDACTLTERLLVLEAAAHAGAPLCWEDG